MATMDVLTNNYARDQTSNFTPSHLARTLFTDPRVDIDLKRNAKCTNFGFSFFVIVAVDAVIIHIST